MDERDLVVAAEGGRSTTRKQLFPAVEPAVADYVAWRGTVPEPGLPAPVVETFDRRFVFYQGADHLILAYFIPGADGEVDRGERRLNWVWYDAVDPADRSAVFTDTTGAERQFTVPPGSVRPSVLDERLACTDDVLPSVFSRAVRATGAPFVQAVYDLAVPEMVIDRVCLLGNAAFVARPHTAAGTAKAAGDAVTLAEALDGATETDDALSSWSADRTRYGGRLVERGRQMSEERLGFGD